MSEGEFLAGERLRELLRQCGQPELDEIQVKKFEEYLSLILRWTRRVNLTAIRDKEGILSRHFVESIACARIIPSGINNLLDFGSGAGFPGLPIALVRPEISVTLAESQNKKSAFLSEAVRVLGIPVRVHAGRAELLQERFDCVALRAVDKMEAAVTAAVPLVRPGGWLALMTTHADFPKYEAMEGQHFSWNALEALPGSEERVLALGRASL
jgi:16S rRNA (guanine527-N7)-methyltransferase